ncbi:unnamed protein product [Prorocentrum cordatum]|uniref:Uncharacterized protein n=1 Tax=Prorocentrum cordatum TaxID=2364126 RepID=A0ABN9XQT7_9DINO|nr:unnamed protein product [Polarella glacialis]
MITNLHLKFVRAVNIASGRALDDDNSGKLRAFPPTERGDINLVGLYITLPLRGSCIGSSMGAVRAPLRGSGLFGGTSFDAFARRAASIGECRSYLGGQEWVDALSASNSAENASAIVQELCTLRGQGGEVLARQAFARSFYEAPPSPLRVSHDLVQN